MGFSGDLRAGLLLRFGADRTPADLWRRLCTYHAGVALAYTVRPTSWQMPLHYLVDDTLGNVWHFAEAFGNDGPAYLAAKEFRILRNSPVLLAGDAANTAKHSGRDPGKRAGGSYMLIIGQSGRQSVALRWEPLDGDSTPPERDALELIDDCLTAWWQFMADHELTDESMSPPIRRAPGA